jgi:hypothetical protein
MITETKNELKRVLIGCENRGPAFRNNDHYAWLIREDAENFYILAYDGKSECTYPKYAWVILIG